MRHAPLLALACALLTGCPKDTPGADTDPQDTADTAPLELEYDPAAPFALVELFTSEGCSSCPPADEVLNGLVEQYAGTGQRVFPMAWHVDYWDYLGWNDPWGSNDYSARQYDYGGAMGASHIYTPQMIVNGAVEFNGSSGSQAASAIASALEQEVTVSVSLWTLAEGEEGALTVDYDVLDAPSDSVLNIVLVQDGLVSEVTSGENRGETLRHEHAVRVWEQVEPGRGQVTLSLAADGLDLTDCWLIGWVEDQQMFSLGATAKEL